MPTSKSDYYEFWQANPRLWEQCKKAATTQMIADGWKIYARKFDRVMEIRALKLWNSVT